MRFGLLMICCLALPLAAACTGEEHCDYYEGAPTADQAVSQLRNPETGICESFSQGGGGTRGGGDCGDYAFEEAPIYIPDWATCGGLCESLLEADCLAASECRGAYLGSGAEPSFFQCWAVAPNGGITQDCAEYGAEDCSRHSDCISVHDLAPNDGFGNFASCAPEPGDDPDPNLPGSCVGEVSCEMVAPLCPDNTIAGRLDGCWTGYCIPIDQCDGLPACAALDETGCVGRDDCSPLYEGVDCSCEGEACVCADWSFASCEVAE